MSDVAFDNVLDEVNSFTYAQCVMLMSRLAQALQNWAPDESADGLFYSKSNMEHLERGINALNAGKGVEHELVEAD